MRLVLYIACNDSLNYRFSLRWYELWSCQNVSGALSYIFLLSDFYIQFVTNLS